MPSPLKIALRIRDTIEPQKFASIVELSKCIVNNKPEEKTISDFKFVHLNDSINYTLNFLEWLNPEYHYRFLNLLRDNLRPNYPAKKIIKRYGHLSHNKGVYILFTDNAEKKANHLSTFIDEVGTSFMSQYTGELVIDDVKCIDTAHSLIHELAHTLSLPLPINEKGERYFDEIPSITFELLFLDYLELIGYEQEEIDFLRYERYDCTIYACTLYLLLNEIIEINRHDIHINEIIASLVEKYPNLDQETVKNAWDWFKNFYQREQNYKDEKRRKEGYNNVIDELKKAAKYIIGFGMSSYYKKDFRENKENAKLFKLMHYLGDGFMTEEEKREIYKEIGLPFYCVDLSKAIEAFEEEYSSKEKTNKQTI